MIPWKQCGTACITKIVKERHEEPVIVYNLALKNWVSYFAGKARVYVYNGNGYDGGKESLCKPTTKKNALWNKGKL